MSKTLEELGYKKIGNEEIVEYYHEELNTEIVFGKLSKTVAVRDEYGSYQYISMEELKAIYKYCEDLGWI